VIVLAMAAFIAQPLPPVDTLVREALENQRNAFGELGEYTYDFWQAIRQFDAKGRLKGETTATGESYQSARRTINVELRETASRIAAATRRNASRPPPRGCKPITRHGAVSRRLRAVRREPISTASAWRPSRPWSFVRSQACAGRL
jgi:hypothetical protein